jgi:hypothetical protein
VGGQIRHRRPHCLELSLNEKKLNANFGFMLTKRRVGLAMRKKINRKVPLKGIVQLELTGIKSGINRQAFI